MKANIKEYIEDYKILIQSEYITGPKISDDDIEEEMSEEEDND